MSKIAQRITGLTTEQLNDQDFNTDPPKDIQEELKKRNKERKELKNIPEALKPPRRSST